MRTLHIFAGAGGGILADVLLGHRCVGAVECDDYAQRVLLARQSDGCLPWFPIFPDVRTFDGTRYRGLADCVSGGFPCQDISAAGKGAGIDGERSGLWREFARIIREVGPRFVFVENSPMLTSRGLGTVLGDLAAMGFDAEWGVLGADDAIWSFGDPCADQKRKRIWICGSLAHTDRLREQQPQRRIAEERGRYCDGGEALADTLRLGFPGSREYVRSGDSKAGEDRETGDAYDGCEGKSGWWQSEPHMDRMVDGLAVGLDQHGAHDAGDVWRVAVGVPNRANRLRCIGNGQVPACAALAWEILTQSADVSGMRIAA